MANPEGGRKNVLEGIRAERSWFGGVDLVTMTKEGKITRESFFKLKDALSGKESDVRDRRIALGARAVGVAAFLGMLSILIADVKHPGPLIINPILYLSTLGAAVFFIVSPQRMIEDGRLAKKQLQVLKLSQQSPKNPH